jgi:hypothetical protein
LRAAAIRRTVAPAAPSAARHRQQRAVQKQFEKYMAQDTHKIDAGMGERKVMRKLSGSMELQELKLK